MTVPEYYPYKSAEAKRSYLSVYDSMAAKSWRIASEERLVQTPYGQTFLRISGPVNGPPLILLPGGCASSLMWAKNIQTLSKEFRTYAIDRPGDVGRTTYRKAVKCREDLVLWLDDLLDELKLKNGVNVMGVSFGGWLAACYAIDRPERVNSAVLLAPACVLNLSVAFWTRIIGAGLQRRDRLRSFFQWLFADMAAADPVRLDSIVDEIGSAIRYLARGVLFRPATFTDEELKSLRVPTFFLVGEHEKIYSPTKAVARLNRLAPRVKTEILAGAGHDLTDVKAEEVSSKAIDFMSAVESAAHQLAG